MALPTGSDVQAVDPVLTNMALGYMQADNRFLADRLFPAVPVDKDSGTYYIYTKKYFFLDNFEERAYGANYDIGRFGVSTSTYTTLQWAQAIPLADEVQANSQVPGDLTDAAIRVLAQRAMIRKERALSSDFFKTSVWSNDDTTTTDWDDFQSGDPITDVLTAARTISNETGYDGNTLACGYIVHQALMTHPSILDAVKYTQTATADTIEGAMASVFGLDNYWVSRASYNSANEGQSMTAAAIIDDDALVCHVSGAPSIFNASAGYTFSWASGGGIGGVRPIFRDEKNDLDLVKFKMQWDQVAVATDLGYFFSDVV